VTGRKIFTASRVAKVQVKRPSRSGKKCWGSAEGGCRGVRDPMHLGRKIEWRQVRDREECPPLEARKDRPWGGGKERSDAGQKPRDW